MQKEFIDTFGKISKITRNDARKNMVNNNSNNNRFIFSTKFSPRGPNVTKIMQDNFHWLQNNEILKGLFLRVITKERIIWKIYY